MKKVLFTLALVFSTVTAFATTPKYVLLKVETNIGFAPPEYAGRYVTQVESDGVVRTIDNKNKQVQVMKLSATAIKNLKAKIDAQKDGKLPESNEPMCMDAPTISITVLQSTGQEILISQQYGCVSHDLEGADSLIRLSNQFEQLASSLK